MEKHGKEITTEEDENLQKQTGSLNFYNDNRIDELMDENEQDVLLNDDADDDLLMQQDIEDDMAAFIVQPKSHNTQYAKRSPNAASSQQRKGQNLTNISNTAHQRQAQNAPNNIMRNQQPENQYPTQSQGKKISSHQNQFGNK